MSGKKGSLDSLERMNGFLEAMNEAGLSVTEHSIFHGDFWREKGKVAIDFFLEGRENYPQAIICANDYMALSITEELENRGIKVPEDVCVSGYDYIDEARFNQPSLTSMVVDFDEMAREAVNIIDRVNMAIHQETITMVEPKIILHKSCGCGKQYNYDDMAKLLQKDYHHIYSMKNNMLATMEYQDSFEEDEYLEVADKYFESLRCEKAWLCLCYHDPDEVNSVRAFTSFSEQMVLKRIFTVGNESEKVNIVFNRKSLLPEEYLKGDETDNLLVFTLHFKNHLYGYFVAKFPDEQWLDIYSQAYILGLATALENAAVQKELSTFESIKELYHKDSLTGLYNRRGFEKRAKDLYKKAEEDNSQLYFISIDMDKLKHINDTYGHTEGDKAIKRIADAISGSLMEGDIAARMGGDEFFVILLGNIPDRDTLFVNTLKELINKGNEGNVMYPVDASVGVCGLLGASEHTLQSLMDSADIKMYENKRNKNR